MGMGEAEHGQQVIEAAALVLVPSQQRPFEVLTIGLRA
jgi:hypothetical protein